MFVQHLSELRKDRAASSSGSGVQSQQTMITSSGAKLSKLTPFQQLSFERDAKMAKTEREVELRKKIEGSKCALEGHVETERVKLELDGPRMRIYNMKVGSSDLDALDQSWKKGAMSVKKGAGKRKDTYMYRLPVR